MSTYRAPLMPPAWASPTSSATPSLLPPVAPAVGTPSPQPNVSPTPPPPTPGTPGYIAWVIKKWWWPQADPATVEKWAATHQQYAQQWEGAANASVLTYAPLFYSLLQGKSGDTLQKALAENIHLWRHSAAEHQSAATALNHAADYLRGLQADLTEIINHYGPRYDTAVEHGNVPAANTIVAESGHELAAAVNHAAGRISSALKGKFGTNPLQQPPPVAI